MEMLTGIREKEIYTIQELTEEKDSQKQVTVEGTIHSIRDMGEVVFVILRKREGLLQTVFEKQKVSFPYEQLRKAPASWQRDSCKKKNGRLTEWKSL